MPAPPCPLFSDVCGIYFVCRQLLKLIAKNKLAAHSSVPYEGFRLTAKGYDWLALKALAKRGTLSALGIQIGVGKESDIFTVVNTEGVEVTRLYIFPRALNIAA